MKFLKEESNAYQYKGYTVIQTSSGYRIKDGNNNWVGGEFDTDVDAHNHIDGLKESFMSDYTYVASKSVQDSDGFYTDYTWYKSDDGLNVFVFGDNEIYTPEAGNFDFETENDAEAQEWFDSYNGFEEDIVEEASDTKADTFCVEDQLEWTDLSGTNYKAIVVSVDDDTVVLDVMPVGGTPVKQSFELTCDSHGKECIIVDMASDKSDAVYVYPELENLEESTAVVDRPLSNLQGTLSSVLLAHKDEVDTLFDKKSAMDFLDRITPEVKDKKYLADVKRDILRGKNSPVEYFYNIILKGDGDGTEKGGKVTKQSKIRKWAKEDLNETWSRGDQVTLWWTDPKWSPTAPCYASCEYVGKSRDGKYRFKSTTYGWEFLLDTVEMTVTTPQGKTFAVDNSSGWIKDVATEGWIAKYIPERGDAVTIIGNVFKDHFMRWGTETDEFIGARGTIVLASSRYSAFDSVEIELDDGTHVWTVSGYRPVEKNPLKESKSISEDANDEFLISKSLAHDIEMQLYSITSKYVTELVELSKRHGVTIETYDRFKSIFDQRRLPCNNFWWELYNSMMNNSKSIKEDTDNWSFDKAVDWLTDIAVDQYLDSPNTEGAYRNAVGLALNHETLPAVLDTQDARKKIMQVAPKMVASKYGAKIHKNESKSIKEGSDKSYNIQFYQIFSNPEKPTDNGKMIAQAGTEDEAKLKGDKLVGKGNYLLKAVCDDGKVRDVDLYSYFNESEEARPLYIIRDSHGNQLSAPSPDDEELWDRVASMEARGRRGLCVVAYTGRKESLKEWNEFSDDDVEDDLTHAAVYGGDSKYCKECGAVKAYDEDGFAYCPECCGELEESYYIGDELLRAKQDRLSLELEDAGWTEVDSKSQDGTYWTFFRKMVDGKGQWKAVVIDSVSGDGEIVDVTYGQARGYEPLSNMDVLRKQLGNNLLP